MEAKWNTICRLRHETARKIVGLQECDAGNLFRLKGYYLMIIGIENIFL